MLRKPSTCPTQPRKNQTIVNNSKCPHCGAKLGDYFYADACPHCRHELENNTKRLIPAQTDAPDKEDAWLTRLVMRAVRLVES